jgi:DHA1 family vesicular acetylcholine transporter-like MFS transporter 3
LAFINGSIYTCMWWSTSNGKKISNLLLFFLVLFYHQANVGLAFLEPTISIWMREEMNATEWQMGLIWLPGFLPHITGVYLTVKLNHYYPKYQWLLAVIGLVLQGTMCVLIPFCKNFGLLMIPISGICFGI